MKRISSRDNSTFKSWRDLATDHRAPRRRGEALIDGIHLLEVCIERGVDIRQIVVSESGRRHGEVSRLLDRLPENPAERFELSDTLFRDVTGVVSPTGIAAVIALPSNVATLIDGDAILLDAVQDAGNVGTLLRVAAAAGVRHAILGRGCAGAWTPKVLRAAQGAHFSLQIREQADLAQVLKEFPGSSIATVARDGVDLYRLDLTGPVAWLLGNEGAGVSPALIAAATQRTTIAMAAATESLNVAAAAAICLFEARRQRQR